MIYLKKYVGEKYIINILMKDKEFGPIVIGKLMNIGGMLQRKANKLLYPFGLNQQQFSILFEIRKVERVCQKSMVNRLVLEKAHVSKIISKLHQMELIEIEPSIEDKRSSWISITPKGIEMVTRCQESIAKWNKEWIKKIDKDERRPMIDNLSVLQNLLKEDIQND